MVISIIIWALFGVIIIYLIVIGIITFGWFQLSNVTNKDIGNDIEVSVVIAVRNESKNIRQLIKSLVNQTYDSKYYEIIIVDDHSTDDTSSLINCYISENISPQIRLISALDTGKKSAISQGIGESCAKLIVTTDGDCYVKTGWLSSIVSYYNSNDYKLIIGPVVYSNEKTLLQKLFSLDFASLVASGAGSVGARLPLMGNGANLAFEREVYISANINSKNYVSGDDVFLIHHVAKKYSSKFIGFLQNEEAIVSTDPPANFTGFLKQRIRWASKATGYKLIWPIIVSLSVFIFNLLLFLMLLGGIFFTWLLPVYFLIILTKFVIDMPLVFRFLSFSKKSNLKPLFFFMEFIYPVYIVISAVSSFIFSFDWKERNDLR